MTSRAENLGAYSKKGNNKQVWKLRNPDNPNLIRAQFKKGHGRLMTKEQYAKRRNVGMTGKHHSEKTKEILKLKTLEQFKKYGHPCTGKHFTEEHCKNIGLAHRGQIPWIKGKHHSIETIKLLKIARAKRIIPKKDTLIEIKIQNYLKVLEIEFFTHQYIKDIEHGYQCDILIPSMKMVIECDGDYWHKYPIGRDIDKIRTSELIIKGFKVLRLWECEIKEMNINAFKNRLGDFYNPK